MTFFSYTAVLIIFIFSFFRYIIRVKKLCHIQLEERDRRRREEREQRLNEERKEEERVRREQELERTRMEQERQRDREVSNLASRRKQEALLDKSN